MGRRSAKRPKFAEKKVSAAAATMRHSPPSAPLRRLRDRLFAPLDIASLVCFRIAFGALMLWEILHYFAYDWIKRDYIDPKFHFTYYGFGWVHPWPGAGMYLHFAVLGVLAACIAIGFFYRISATLFFIGFAYVFLLDETRYLNHFYLICLISFLMICIPAHRALSFDAWRNPRIRSDTVPTWALWLLRAQLGVVYFYGGLAKLNVDWFSGDAMRTLLLRQTTWPIVGRLFADDSVLVFLSYGGALFDLLVVPLLLWRRTRPVAFVAAVLFHFTNANWFEIGVFPWFMIAATTLFFQPDWPRRVLRRLRPAAGQNRPSLVETVTVQRRQDLTLGLLGAYWVIQLLVPFRHYLYPGDVNWTEEGHRFSWRMMLVTKRVAARFFATDPVADSTWEVNPLEYLTPIQQSRMIRRPDMILQFSRHVADDLRGKGHPQIEVRAKVVTGLQQRPPQWMIDPNVDLAAQPRTLAPAPWIVPFGGVVVDRTKQAGLYRSPTVKEGK